MGLQDVLVMSAVPVPHEIIDKPRHHSDMSLKKQTSSAEDPLRIKQLSNENNYNNRNGSGNNKDGEQISDNGANHQNHLYPERDVNIYTDDDNSFRIEDDDEDEQVAWSEVDTDDELKLSKALHSWMPGYVITPLPRQGHTLRQPVFSARLGRETAIRRTPSSESIDTQLSLFSCSSHGSRMAREKKRRRPRRRKTICEIHPEGRLPLSATSQKEGSRWVELAKRRKGELDKFMMAHSHALTQGINLTDESEAYQLCDPDEQRALYLCGKRNKMALVGGMKKSESTCNVNSSHLESVKREKPQSLKKHRVASAGAKEFFGKPIDFQQELRKQMMSHRLSALTFIQRTRASLRRSLHRSLSKHSQTSAGSSDVFLSSAAGTPHTMSPPPLSPRVVESGNAPGGGGSANVTVVCGGDPGPQQKKQENVNMWKGDSQILAIDLKRELTSKVKQRIAVTTSALERVTGMGDNNEQRPYTCHLAEFPAFIDEDFSLKPKISQKLRISPQLSDVIKSDIRVRMGRPRYHEIRMQDLEIWNRGQTLDRAHRNLKVFNWLHSLKEEEFELASLQQTINDVPPDLNNVTFGDMVLVRAVDDPDVKPLYQHKKNHIR